MDARRIRPLFLPPCPRRNRDTPIKPGENSGKMLRFNRINNTCRKLRFFPVPDSQRQKYQR